MATVPMLVPARMITEALCVGRVIVGAELPVPNCRAFDIENQKLCSDRSAVKEKFRQSSPLRSSYASL